jgi:hypothetical protein
MHPSDAQASPGSLYGALRAGATDSLLKTVPARDIWDAIAAEAMRRGLID